MKTHNKKQTTPNFAKEDLLLLSPSSVGGVHEEPPKYHMRSKTPVLMVTQPEPVLQNLSIDSLRLLADQIAHSIKVCEKVKALTGHIIEEKLINVVKTVRKMLGEETFAEAFVAPNSKNWNHNVKPSSPKAQKGLAVMTERGGHKKKSSAVVANKRY
jgi:hypothetical protein